jgi:hypothetical protein
MDANQLDGFSQPDASVRTFLDRLKATADALDAALADAKRFYDADGAADAPADRAA